MILQQPRHRTLRPTTGTAPGSVIARHATPTGVATLLSALALVVGCASYNGNDATNGTAPLTIPTDVTVHIDAGPADGAVAVGALSDSAGADSSGTDSSGASSDDAHATSDGGGDSHATCVDPCEPEGGARCVVEGAAGGAVQRCLDLDKDGCFAWTAAPACEATEVCTSGACAPKCPEQNCSVQGAVKSDDQGQRVTCFDFNGDGCLAWGGAKPCTNGQVCANGKYPAARASGRPAVTSTKTAARSGAQRSRAAPTWSARARARAPRPARAPAARLAPRCATATPCAPAATSTKTAAWSSARRPRAARRRAAPPARAARCASPSQRPARW